MTDNNDISPICLIADNDQVVSKFLKEVLEKVFPKLKLVFASDGRTALEIYSKINKQPVILLSELRLPSLDGRQLMRYAKQSKVAPLYLLALTNEISQRARLELIQGGVDEILNKPLATDKVVTKIKSAIKQLVLEKKVSDFPDEKAIEKAVRREVSLDMSNLLNSFIDSKGFGLPDDKILFYTEFIKYVFEKMEGDFAERSNTIDSLKFLNIYKLHLEDSKIGSPVMKNGYPSQGVMEQYPKFIDQIFKYLTGLNKEREILYYVYENIDGTGMPEKKRLWHIPLGSRVIRVLVEYDNALKENKNDSHKALEAIWENVKRLYDHTIVAYLDQFLAVNYPDPGAPEEAIEKNLLRENHIISRNVISKDGLLLMPRKTKMDKSQIQTLWNKIDKEGMIGSIFIYTTSKENSGKSDKESSKNIQSTATVAEE